MSVALAQLLPPSQSSRIPAYAGAILATTLCGWAFGGMAAGVMADYIGRKRTMIYAILTYSIMTGVSALSWSWVSFAVFRFLAGLAIGSEWVTGTSMTAEFWPDSARGKGSGLFQCGFGIGFFFASVVWLFVGKAGPGAWRVMYLIGVLPALLTLWIRRAIPESPLWEKASERREAARRRQRSGTEITPDERALARFTFVDLFAIPTVRTHTVIAFLMATASAVGFWGISTWVPPYIGSVAAASGLSSAQWASFTGMAYNAGTIAGYIALGFLADSLGRKPVTLAYFALAWLFTPVLFLWTHDLPLLLFAAAIVGFFGSGQLTWLAVWLPELYPTSMRATAVGFIFNAPRLLAAAGTLMAGTLIVRFGGYGNAAMIVATIYVLGLAFGPFLPETRGKALPDSI